MRPLIVAGPRRGDTLYAPHRADRDRLKEVVMQLRELGAPTIPVYFNGTDYEALDGSHRIAGASALGIPVTLFELELGDTIGPGFDTSGRVVAHVLPFLRGSRRPRFNLVSRKAAGR